MATVPFVVEEFGGVGRTNSPMRFPIVIPVPVSANILTVNTSRVLDGATPVQAQFEIIARYGGSNSQLNGVNDDATRPARLIHCWMTPTLTANGVKNYTYDSSGGSGNNFAGITVQAVSTHYVVNTGTGGIICHVPRTGAQEIIRFLQMVSGAPILTSGGGLWTRGTTAEAQASDYFSRFDTAADGLTNNWSPTDPAQPVKWFTELTKPGPLRYTITVRRVRLRATSGAATAFQGKGRAVGSSGPIVPRDVLCDVQLTFFKNRPEILLQILNLGTGGGHWIQAAEAKADISMDGFGIDFATVFGGTDAALATRDEGAVGKWATATATADVAIRQRTGNFTAGQVSRPAATYISGGNYGWTLDETGPFTLASATTQIESGFDVSIAGGGAGLLVAPNNWKNRYPMGWSYTRSTGVLRWELLNPAEGDICRNNLDHHKQMGLHWLYGEAWLIPHAAALSNAQRVEAVRATTGRHTWRHNHATVDTDLTHPIRGSQKVTLVGRVAWSVWNASGAWRLVPRPLASRTIASGMMTNVGGQTSLPPLAGGPPGATRYEQACARYDQWFEAQFDDVDVTGTEFTGTPVGVSMEATRCVPNGLRSVTIGAATHVGPLGWRNDGGYPGSNAFCASNDYEQCSYPGLFWLSGGQVHHFAHLVESCLHLATIDVQKTAYGAGVMHGRILDLGSANFHTAAGDVSGEALEYQQQHEAIVFAYVLTGDDVYRQVCDYVLNFIHNYFFGGVSNHLHDVRNRWEVTGQYTVGSNVVTGIADTSAIVIGGNQGGTHGVKASYRPATPQGANLGTASSSGNVITLNTPIAGGDASGRVFYGQSDNSSSAQTTNSMHCIGAQLRFPDPGGPVYEVTAMTSTPVDGTWTTPYVRHFVVKPTPPALTNQACRMIDWIRNTNNRVITSKTATTITIGGGDGSLPTASTPLTIWASAGAALRRTGWPLHTLVALARVFGERMRTFQRSGAGFNLFEAVQDQALHVVYSEQRDSSDGAIAQMGGLGTTITGTLINAYGGTNSQINVTSTDYVMGPLLEAHVLAEAAATWGYGSTFTLAHRTTILNYMDRYCRFMFMGVDGLSPIESGGDMLKLNQPQTIPMARGGDLQSPTSYHMVAHEWMFVVVEDPTAAGRTGLQAWRKCANDLTQMTTVPDRFARTNGNKTFTSATGVGADVLTYVATKKWNAAGAVDLPRRTAYTRKAIQGWIDAATFMTTAAGGQVGQYHNPNTWAGIWGGRSTAGGAVSAIRFRHWLVNYGAMMFDIVATGFAGGTQDTTPPTETLLMELVTRSDNQITINGPAAIDNVAVVDYSFFKGGVQDGPAQASTQHTFSGLTPGDTYTLTRRARDAAGLVSNDSNALVIQTTSTADTTPPTVPTGLEATAGTDTVTLTWLPSTDEESGIKRYLIERTPPGSIVGEVIP